MYMYIYPLIHVCFQTYALDAFNSASRLVVSQTWFDPICMYGTYVNVYVYLSSYMYVSRLILWMHLIQHLALSFRRHGLSQFDSCLAATICSNLVVCLQNEALRRITTYRHTVYVCMY